jgi:hypothetical protein
MKATRKDKHLKQISKRTVERIIPTRLPKPFVVPLIIGLLLFVSYSYYFYIGLCWNIESRLSLTHAIVRDHTFQIDKFWISSTNNKPRTYDVAYNPKTGHYYCDKAIGAELLGVPGLWLYQRLNVNTSSFLRGLLGNYIINITATALPAAIAGVMLFLVLGYLTPLVAPRVWITLAYGLGTITFPYATMFFGHETAAALLLISFCLLFRMRRRGWSRWGGLAAGLFAGYALITDFLSFTVVAGLAIYALFIVWQELRQRNPEQRPWSQALLALLPFALGMVAFLPLQMWYNQVCFGSPFASAYRFEIIKEFREGMSQGLMGITAPKLEALFQLTLGQRRGIFYESPFLLFAIPGFYLMIRQKVLRLEGIVCAGIFVTTLLVNSGYYLWWGGATYGARFLLVGIPFLALPAFYAMPYAPRAFKILAVAAMCFMSIVVISTPLIAEGSPNPLFEGEVQIFVQEFIKGIPLRETQSFNIVQTLLRLDKPHSVAPWFAFIALCLVYLRSLRIDSLAETASNETSKS